MKKLFNLVLAMFLLPSILFLSGCKNKPNDPPPTDAFIYEFSEDGKYVYFGEYPQTIKAEDVTIISSKPDQNGYYKGSDGERYIKQECIQRQTLWGDSYAVGFTDTSLGTTMTIGEEYYFKVEKIKWTILKKENNSYLLFSDILLDTIEYQEISIFDGSFDYITTANGAPYGTYANNYKYSTLRNFLNSDFYIKSFTVQQKEVIQKTIVDNGIAAHNPNNSYNEKFVCENTEDYIFALSYSEITNTQYGFSGDLNTDESILKRPSDYAISKGILNFTEKFILNYFHAEVGSSTYENNKIYINTAGYFLRSPDYFSKDVMIVKGLINNTECGVAPALYINIA